MIGTISKERMGQELRPEDYDQRMSLVGMPYEDSPWRPVYDAVVSFMPSDNSIQIVDIGCGTGRMAEALRRAGYTNYVGYDFSPRRIEEARRYVPGFTFHVLDCFSDEAKLLARDGQVFVVTEVLEHIEGDREVISALLSQSLVIFSVPNYDSAGHVRTYPSREAISERYGDLIELDPSRFVPLPNTKRPEKIIFVCAGRRR